MDFLLLCLDTANCGYYFVQNWKDRPRHYELEGTTEKVRQRRQEKLSGWQTTEDQATADRVADKIAKRESVSL
jgi:hypothetical protein